jgi:hypothetical protein
LRACLTVFSLGHCLLSAVSLIRDRPKIRLLHVAHIKVGVVRLDHAAKKKLVHVHSLRIVAIALDEDRRMAATRPAI